MLTDEEDISNYPAVNININSVAAFELLKLQLEGEIINYVVSVSIKSRETLYGKPLLCK